MTTGSPPKAASKQATAKKRKYNSPLRKQQAAETRERIISAGAELVHGLPSWDWTNLSAKAVGEHAGISERTVHRHFPTERKLRDTVLQRLVEESGVRLDTLNFDNFQDTVVNTFDYLSSFAARLEITTDPSMTSLDAQRKRALLAAVREKIPGWTDQEQTIVAAMLEMFWDPINYGRLKSGWELDTQSANRALIWMIGLVRSAVNEGNKP